MSFGRFHNWLGVKPIRRMLFVGGVSIVTLNLIRLLIGGGPSLAGTAICTLLAIGISETLSATPQWPKDWTAGLKSWATNSPVRVIKLLVAVLMIVGFSAATTAPSDELAQAVFRGVKMAGIFIVIMLPPAVLMFQTHTGQWQSVARVMQAFVFGLAAYSLFLWLVGLKGDGWATVLREQPHEVVIALIVGAICWVIFSMARTLSWEPVKGGDLAKAGLAWPLQKPSQQDERHTAFHEAGHALCYAALGKLPDNSRMVMNDGTDPRGVLGFVTGVDEGNRLSSQVFVEWLMLVFLAGKMGEMIGIGQATLGAGSDHCKWQSAARQYLANHYEGIYYIEPQNKFEQVLNDEKLQELERLQLLRLQQLFDLNREVFRDLAEEFLAKRVLERSEMIPFLARVTLPEGFPRPFGDFSVFCQD